MSRLWGVLLCAVGWHRPIVDSVKTSADGWVWTRGHYRCGRCGKRIYGRAR